MELVFTFAIIIMIVLVIFVGKLSFKTDFISDTDFVSKTKTSADSSSTSRNQVQSQMVINDPNRTTSRLVGNGLAYFVFWFFGAPILTLVVFIFLFMSGFMADGPGWGLFLIFLIGLLITFVYHTFQIVYSGFNASVAPDEPATKTAFISATPQSNSGEERVSCPMCAEKILPQAKICHFCKSVLNPTQSD